MLKKKILEIINNLLEQFKRYKKEIYKIRQKGKKRKNFIIAKLNIYDDYFINKDIRIINSFDIRGSDYYSIQKKRFMEI